MSRETVSDTALRWLSAPPGDTWTCAGSGTYRYGTCEVNETIFRSTEVVEQYIVWRDEASGNTLTRVCRDSLRTPPHVALYVEASAMDDRFSHLRFTVRDAEDVVLKVVEYTPLKERLHWTTGLPAHDGTQELSVLTLPSDTLILPLMRNFLGSVIVASASRPGGTASIVVPELSDPRAATVFAPTLGTRKAIALSESSKTITSAEHTFHCRAYRFIGGPYDEASTFWVCQESQRLVRYIFTPSSGPRWSADLVSVDTLLT